MENKPLLSICIPTYNRAEILDETLNQLVNDPSCDERVEIIVSDNCSTDNTKSVVEKYPKVKYYRNEENVKDANFTIVLSLGTGKYLKLLNDTARFNKGKIEKMLSIIQQNQYEQKNLFFYTNSGFLCLENTITVNDNFSFIDKISFYSTWIANFGVWRNEWKKIEEKDRFVESQFTQVDWSYKIVSNGKPTLIAIDEFIHVFETKKKGNYNIFNTFLTKYFFVLKQHGIGGFVFEKEKYRLFRYFILGWYFKLKQNKEYEFSTSSANKIILKYYWYEPYFLPLLLIYSIKTII